MKNTFKWGFAFMMITLFLLNSESNKQNLNDSRDSFPEIIDTTSFTRYFKNLKKFSGNVLVAVDGKPIYEKSFGLANIELNVKNTSETKFRIGSITKQFTAMAIMILQEQGKLKVTDKLSDYFSDIPDTWKDMTIHQLLTHTAGLVVPQQMAGWQDSMMLYRPFEEIIDNLKTQPLVAAPGEKFHYSGLGYFIMASLIQKVSGKTYCEFLQEHIFDKAEMENSGCDTPNEIIMNRASGYSGNEKDTYNSKFIYGPIRTGGGNLYSTTGDLLKWDRALYNNTLISEESKMKMFTPYGKERQARIFAPGKNYTGYGFIINKSDLGDRLYHSGHSPGFRARIDRCPEIRLLIVILTNDDITPPQLFFNFPDLVIQEFRNYKNHDDSDFDNKDNVHAELMHSYTFDNVTANDRKGKAHGKLIGGAKIRDGHLILANQGEYVSLPGEKININSYASITLEAFLESVTEKSPFTMFSYFGDSVEYFATNFIFQSVMNGNLTKATINCTNNEWPLDGSSEVSYWPLNDGKKHHIVTTFDNENMRLYIDGKLVGENSTDGQSLNIIANISNKLAFLGKSGFEQDRTWIGTIDCFNIYEGVLSYKAISQSANKYLSK
ncbi:serine hydrolase [Tamlana flava]|uniref:serine hydrolase n=1 Tax=Tamlana flava TaxID=3158572 RepID=UPI00351BD683